jgi:hypothetical protein
VNDDGQAKCPSNFTKGIRAMSDRINRRLLIFFGLCLLLSVGGIVIGILGFVDLLDSDLVDRVTTWIEPIISIRSSAPEVDSLFQSGPSAMELEATRLAEVQISLSETYADWPVVFQDSFDTNSSGWPEFEEQDSLADITVEIIDGKYRWVTVANDGFVWWSYPDMDSFTNFYAEVDIHQTDGDPYGEMGIVFHLDGDNFYLFEISNEYFSLWKSVPDGWEDLIDWTSSPMLLPNENNRLGVLFLDDQIYLFINDHMVAEYAEAEYKFGVVGLAIGMDEADDAGSFEFDNLAITAPVDNP